MLLMIYSNKIREIKTKSPSFKYATYVERQRHLLVRGVFENQKRYVEVEKNTGVFELTCDVCPCLCGRYIVGVQGLVIIFVIKSTNEQVDHIFEETITIRKTDITLFRSILVELTMLCTIFLIFILNVRNIPHNIMNPT